MLYFYLDGNLIDSVKMDAEILDLSSKNIYIGAANGKNTNKDFFYGNIANVEMYDSALEPSEIIEICKNKVKPKIRNFGNFKSSEFLYSSMVDASNVFFSM